MKQLDDEGRIQIWNKVYIVQSMGALEDLREFKITEARVPT